MFGHLFQPTWTRLAATAEVGASSITLQEPVDWVAGQKIVIVIATSARVDYPILDQNEVRTITDVSGSTVTFATSRSCQDVVSTIPTMP